MLVSQFNICKKKEINGLNVSQRFLFPTHELFLVIFSCDHRSLSMKMHAFIGILRKPSAHTVLRTPSVFKLESRSNNK